VSEVLGIVFLVSQFVGTKTLTERMLANALEGKSVAPHSIWKRLNLAWRMLFLLLHMTNLFVAYNFSTNTWVNFKLYGVLSSLFVFGLAQSFYLTKYMLPEKQS
jgi:intracellular septation protein